MSGGKRSSGYTIVEVLIVLAVSGMMFVIAAQFVGGKQEKTAFIQGTNEFSSRLQDVAQQVRDGQFSDVPLDCGYSGTTTTITSNPGSSTGQGQHSACVFLGKMLHLSLDGKKDEYEILSLAGGRVKDGKPITDMVTADPTVATDLTDKQSVPQHFDITNIKVTDVNGVDRGAVYAFGFLISLGSFDDSGALKSEAQSVGLWYVPGVGSGDSSSTTETKVKAGILPAGSVEICLSDGTRYAALNMGTDSGQFNVTVKSYLTNPQGVCVS